MSNKQLTPQQIAAVEAALRKSAADGNVYAASISIALVKANETGKRKIIAGSFGQMFECLQVMGMAISTKSTLRKIKEMLHVQ